MSEMDRMWKGFVMTLSKEELSEVSTDMAELRKRCIMQVDKVTAEYLMFVKTAGGFTLDMPEEISWE